MTARPAISSAVLEQAIAWKARLLSGAASADTLRECERWRNAQPSHEQAWQALEEAESGIAGLSTGERRLVSGTLEAMAQDRRVDLHRRRVIKSLMLAGLAAPALFAWREYNGSFGLPTDYATRVGQRSQVTLPDGSGLRLNTDSAVDVRLAAGERRILLRRGEIFVEAGGTHAAWQQPLTVQAGALRLTSADGAFLLHRRPHHDYLQVRAGRVDVQGAVQSMTAQAGECWRVEGARLVQETDTTFDATGWLDGALVAQQMPLERFVQELGRYRRGWLGCDADAAGLRVSGVFQLDDTDRALTALTRVLPVRLAWRSPYWVSVVPA